MKFPWFIDIRIGLTGRGSRLKCGDERRAAQTVSGSSIPIRGTVFSVGPKDEGLCGLSRIGRGPVLGITFEAVED